MTSLPVLRQTFGYSILVDTNKTKLPLIFLTEQRKKKREGVFSLTWYFDSLLTLRSVVGRFRARTVIIHFKLNSI